MKTRSPLLVIIAHVSLALWMVGAVLSYRTGQAAPFPLIESSGRSVFIAYAIMWCMETWFPRRGDNS